MSIPSPLSTKSSVIGMFLVLIAAFGYGALAILVKLSVSETLPMFSVITLRFIGAAICFWVFMLTTKTPKATLKEKIKGIGLGIWGDAQQTALFFLSIIYVGASLSALLLYTYPVLVLIIESVIYKKKHTPLEWLGISIAFIGAAIVIDPFRSLGTGQYNIGILCGLGAGLAYACYLTIGARLICSMDARASSAYVTTGASISFFILALVVEGGLVLPSTSRDWILLSAMTIVSTVVPLFCLLKGLQLIGSSKTARVFVLEPLFTVILATLILQEKMTLMNIVGSSMIIGSILLVQILQAKKPSVTEPAE